MADQESNKPKPGRAAPTRRRGSVTIDLPADPVDATPTSEATAQASGPDEPGTGAARRQRSVLPTIIVILVAVILFGGYLAFFTDLGGGDDGRLDELASQNQQLADDLDALRTEMAAAPPVDLTNIEARLEAVESVATELEAMRTDLGEALETLAAITSLEADLRAEVERLSQDVLAAAAAAGDPAAAAALGADISLLADRIAELENIVAPEALAGIGDRLDSVESDLATLTEAVALLSALAEERAQSIDATRILAVTNLRTAAAEGRSFSAELAVASEFGVPPDLAAALNAVAATGVPSRTQLASAFPAVANAIVDAASGPEEEAGFWDRVFANARNVVVVQPTVPTEGDSAPAIVSRMQGAVDDGDFGKALVERAGLPEAALAVSADWAADAEARIALDANIAALAEAVLAGQ